MNDIIHGSFLIVAGSVLGGLSVAIFIKGIVLWLK